MLDAMLLGVESAIKIIGLINHNTLPGCYATKHIVKLNGHATEGGACNKLISHKGFPH